MKMTYVDTCSGLDFQPLMFYLHLFGLHSYAVISFRLEFFLF